MNKHLKLSATACMDLICSPGWGSYLRCTSRHSHSFLNTGAWYQVQPVGVCGAREHSEAPGGEGADSGGRPLRGRLGECLARGVRGKGAVIAMVIDPHSSVVGCRSS